ncbi:type I-MYXAN CRISPR-associated protein Cas6/Cmx6 [Solidesulfovibrio alcoholivorans]|uniref:type I-MYXAN CRISPR-associated protein Cas6/Cmx6 n=1 Tax=Solidesulfovibrio alcoholivorans TaxID=81406 RepID=UPI00138DE542|nr:type I-MYXAN CRISPR-associated protein Cas6/Cmx6 [Solidesulfovibrio alcoholivorans]
MKLNNSLDLLFSITTRGNIPVDHAYSLYGALCRVMPTLHEHINILIHPIKGKYTGDGHLSINKSSHIRFRCKEQDVSKWLSLAGMSLSVNGCDLLVGGATAEQLISASVLRSAFVTTRNGHDENRFRQELARQLSDGKVVGETHILARKTMTIKEKKIVGFEVVVSGLDAESSIRLQEHGLGGRKKMGGGFFLPFSPR